MGRFTAKLVEALKGDLTRLKEKVHVLPEDADEEKLELQKVEPLLRYPSITPLEQWVATQALMLAHTPNRMAQSLSACCTRHLNPLPSVVEW